MNLDDCRRHFAQNLRLTAGLRSARLLEAFARVPREKYLGPGPWHIPQGAARGKPDSMEYYTTDDPCDLYHNTLVAIDCDRRLNNGQPGSLGFWIQALDPKPGDRVFHLGCGPGYYTAIIAEMVGPDGRVTAIEVLPELADRARENLSGYHHVTVQATDGEGFDPGVCDAMFINAGVTHPHPAWLARLAENGRIILPLTTTRIGVEGPPGAMARFTRRTDGVSAEFVSMVAIYNCTNVRDADLDAQIGKALRDKSIFKMQTLRLDPHERTDTCILHGPHSCVSAWRWSNS